MICRRSFFSSSALLRAGESTTHFRTRAAQQEVLYKHPLPHPVFSAAELTAVQVKHTPPVDWLATAAYAAIRCVRVGFDVASGYAFGRTTETKVLRRILFLETVAGVPGACAATLRHLRSLRRVQRDGGWIVSLLEESENERMHMLMFSQLKTPGPLFRAGVLVAQGVFWNAFFMAYIVSPRFCHLLVAYLEEEAVKTYTSVLAHMDAGDLPAWSKASAPPIARRYYNLPDDATMRDVILNVRADEAWHRDANHLFATLRPDDMNPMVLDNKSEKKP